MILPVERPEDIPQAFVAGCVGYYSIDCVNWPQSYPYKPDAVFGVAFSGEGLYLHFKVREDEVLAFVGEDGGPVWKDSCVECFLRPEPEGPYYNLECNCIGRILLGCGFGRQDREAAPNHVLQGVKRWASIGYEPFGRRLEDTRWETALIVPFASFFRHDINSFTGAIATANFFKCGGTGSEEHYLSWSPISVPSPDFHRPEFFSEIRFAH